MTTPSFARSLAIALTVLAAPVVDGPHAEEASADPAPAAGTAASDTMADARPLGLAGFLALVRDRHPLFPAEGLAPDIARRDQARLAAAQDWRASASSAWRWSEPVDTTPFSPRQTESANLGASLGRAFWATGGLLAVDWQASWTEQDLPTITIPSATGTQSLETGPGSLFRNAVGVRYTQPLWRNRGGTLDRVEHAAAGHRIDAATLEARENQEAFLLELATGYIGWARWSALREVARDRLEVAAAQLELVRELREANLVDRVDVLRAEEARAAARRALALAEAELRGQRAELAVLAQIDDLAGRTPALDLTATVDLPPAGATFAAVRDDARRLRMVNDRMAEVRERRDGAAARTDPALDLAVDLNLRGGDRDAYHDAWNLRHPEAAVSLEFRQALGAHAADAAREGADLRLRRLEHEHHRARLALEAAIARQRTRLAGLADALVLHARQVDVAGRKAAAERDLYGEGRNQLNFVLQAQDAVAAARRAWYETAARYHRLVLVYRELTDRLLDDDGAIVREALAR
jgi:outer membrane protein TolC